ncbi:MAG TPA: hypothetical protein VMU48_04645 [Terracidiphilus sp.]|nr:hypothetical protein [Terracidiphilus sp.]
MKHLTEDELIDRYYGDDRANAAQHLENCPDCAHAYAALEADLADLRPVATPLRNASYGEQVWSRISPLLPARTPHIPARSFRGRWLALGSAAACALMLATAFYAGRLWEHRRQHATTATAQQPVQNHVVVVLLSDHLDRSERLLVELKHAHPDDSQIISPLRDEARSLLASNRKCRQQAEKTGDPALTKALDHLNELLTQLANQPGGLNAAAITRLQDEMNGDGLLFEVRVLRSRIPTRQAATMSHTKGGTV